jgi:apolipoprotein N-acyltransferase
MMWWVKYVVLFGVLYIAAGWGVYFVAMGALLRRLARRFAFPLAVALSWTGVELVRALVPPPFGLGWFRLGYYTHAQVWLSGAARVLGVEGLTFVVAALGGLAAALWTERRLRRPAAIAGLAPLFLAALAALVVPAPETREGPRVLLVQPGFTQRRKQFDDARANIAFSRDLTHRAAREVGPVDLVCWGESMLYCQLFSKRAEAAIRAGTARGTEWGESCTAAELDQWQDSERTLVQREILALGDPARPFAEGTAFAVGAELLDLVDGRLRRKVALAFFDSAGQPAEPALKRFLVPLGETFFGLERFAWVRSLARSAAGYLPDLLPGDETGRFELRTRDGRTFRMSGTICFDNAHPWPYLDAVRSDPVDFHLVTSNEAWYETSCEMDQMLAFSRVFALMTGRAIVRATNSGVSAVLGPDGAEIGRVRDAGGRDRAVAGFGAWIVPVPRAEHSGAPPYASWSRTSEGLWIALLVLAALVARPR